MSYQLKLWDSKRERKLTSPSTLPAVRKPKGPSKLKEELTGCGPAQPRRRQEAGGRGKGQARPEDRSPYRAANRPPVSNHRPPEILDGRGETQGAGTDLRGQGWGRGGEKARRTRESAPVKLLAA